MALPEWLPSLKSIQRLRIANSSKLSYLPKGMQGLTALREFTIVACPNLGTRCRQDWPQIAHVPKVSLNADY